jgi:hypothetical protein
MPEGEGNMSRGRGLCMSRGSVWHWRRCGKEVLVKCSRSARVSVLGALEEDMLGGATEHTTGKAIRVATLKVGDRINGNGNRAVTGSWLVVLHRLLGRVHIIINSLISHFILSHDCLW